MTIWHRHSTIFLVAFLSACSAADDATTQAGDPESAPAPIEALESIPTLIDSIQWQEERIDFYDLTPAGERHPVIYVTKTGPVSGGEIHAYLEQNALHPVTAAELWRHVTGRDDVPELLAIEHELRAELEDRPVEYQSFDQIKVEKAFSFSAMFPQPAPNTCWAKSNTAVVTVSPGASPNQAFICSSSNPAGFTDSQFVMLPPQFFITNSNSCTPTGLFNSTGHIKIGFYNDSATAQVQAKGCQGIGNNPWTCFPSAVVNPQSYYTGELAASGTQKRLGLRALALSFAVNVVFAAAIRNNHVPAFGTTRCEPGSGDGI